MKLVNGRGLYGLQIVPETLEASNTESHCRAWPNLWHPRPQKGRTVALAQQATQVEERLCIAGRMEKLLRGPNSQGLGSAVAWKPCYLPVGSRNSLDFSSTLHLGPLDQ